MDRARWEKLEAICFAALDRDPAARAGFLAQACEGDAGLARDAAELLRQLDLDPDFLEAPVASFSPDVGPPAILDNVPQESIGPYRLVRPLGRGGMGEVFLAIRETEDVRQQVALKVIRRGMDTDEVLGRFRLERRILATLHHPNIAQLMDAAATEDGRPYFVMEYVEGLPLTEYCDQRGLPVADRLTLFQTICGAVHHAHQNLVVHRDLKPSNILVTESGVPKLLDFGIGKVLSQNDVLSPGVETRTDVRLLTPEYAAPEQLLGRPVTTATDVHGLGLLLHRLLTGRHPLLSGAERGPELERAILESEPIRLSAAAPAGIRRLLEGDLDNIVAKALRKEPERRYPSAAALADDLQRHLDGMPVSARADTIGYRVGKFVRRNAAGVAVAMTLVLALAATTIVTLVQSRRVAAESARVRRERDKALEVRGFLMEMFGATGADQAVGDTVTARGLLDLQAGRLAEAYRGRPELEAEMTEVLADGYDRLGLYKEAEPLARRALELRRKAAGADAADTSGALNLLGWVLHERGQSKEAAPILEGAVAVRRAAGDAARGDLSRSLNDLGVVYNAINRYPEASVVLTEALAIRRATLGDDHRAVGITANNLAAAYYFRGQVDSAVAIQDLAVRSLQRSVGPDHQRTVVALGNLAAFKRAKGDWESAVTDYRELLARQTRLQGKDHPVTARVMASLATLLAERGSMGANDSLRAEAESLFRGTLAAFETRLGPTHPQVGTILDRLAGVVADRGRATEALALERRGLEIIRAASGPESQPVAAATNRLASIEWRAGDRRQAVIDQRAAVAIFIKAVGADHAETGRATVALCEYLFGAGDLQDAVATCRKATAAEEAGKRTRGLAIARLRLAQATNRLGRTKETDSLVALVRASADTSAIWAPIRRLLDSVASRTPTA